MRHETGTKLFADRLRTEQADHSRLHAGRTITEGQPRILRIRFGTSWASCSKQARRCLTRKGSRAFSLSASLRACTRPGSLDASITEEVANDFAALFAKYPNITHVFFNGRKPETAFRRHALPALPEDRHVLKRLPSTSSGYAAMRLETKVQAWCVVKKVLS